MPIAGSPVRSSHRHAAEHVGGRRSNASSNCVVDGVKAGRQPRIELAARRPGEARRSTFSFQRGGLHRGEVRLVGEDGSKYDDRRFFAIDLTENVPVAVVESRQHEIPYLDEAYYLEQALAAGRPRPGRSGSTTLLAGDLAGRTAGKIPRPVLRQLPALDAETAERLGDYVAGGGNLVWIAGDNVEPEAYNAMNQQAGGRLLPAPLAESGRSPPARPPRRLARRLSRRQTPGPEPVDRSAVAVRIGVGPAARLHDGRCRKRRCVLARLDDGQPLLVERRVGDGRVLMLGIAPETGWSNLPLRPIFMPLDHPTDVRFGPSPARAERANRRPAADAFVGQGVGFGGS